MFSIENVAADASTYLAKVCMRARTCVYVRAYASNSAARARKIDREIEKRPRQTTTKIGLVPVLGRSTSEIDLVPLDGS